MVTTPIKLTFEEYLNYDDGTDNRYELFEEGLVKLPPESGENDSIANYLFLILSKLINYKRIRPHSCELQVPGNPQNRYPDLVVLKEDHLKIDKITKKRLTITLDMPAPLLVVEVVSPYRSQKHDNYKRDYIEKRQQYAARGIIEYWIVDPQIQQVTVLKLVNGEYQATVFTGNQAIVSDVFPQLELTAAQVFEL